MNLKQYIEGQAPNDWSLGKESGSAGRLTLRFRVRRGDQDTHSETVGAAISGEDFSYTLESVDREYGPDGYEVVQTWADGFRALEDVPCFLRRNLPGRARAACAEAARWGLTALVSCADVLEACATAAAQAGITLDFSGVDAGNVHVPLIDNGSTIGAVLTQLSRYVPNMTTRVNGSTVTVCGGQGELTSAATRAQGVVECSPAMKTGTLTVGSTVVDLAEVYAANAGSLNPLNWNANCARLICDALADCAEADAMAAGRYIFLAAREAGASGNSITLTLTGVDPQGTAAHAKLVPAGDLTQAGRLTDGENTVELEAAAGARKASGVFYTDGTSESVSVSGIPIAIPDNESDAEAWTAAFTAAGCGIICTGTDAHGEIDVSVEAVEPGAAGNEIVIEVDGYQPVQLTGGADGGRTVGDIVDAINGEDGFAFTASGGAVGARAHGSVAIGALRPWRIVRVVKDGETVLSFTITPAPTSVSALAAAMNANAGFAALLSAGAEGNTLTLEAREDGEGLNSAVVGIIPVVISQAVYVTLEGGAAGSPITLEAKVAGSAGNGIGVRASGCFGTAGQFSGGTDASGEEYGVTPFSGGGGQDIRAAYEGLLGMQAREVLPDDWVVTRHAVESSLDNEPPSCVIGVASTLTGGQRVVFRVPEGASEYQRGALVVDVDVDRTQEARIEREAWEYDPERARELARRELRHELRRMNGQRERAQGWMLVKGSPLPPGWHIASGAVNMRQPLDEGDAEVWRRFWTQFGALRLLKDVQGIGFGVPYMFPVNAEDAYPPDEAPDFEEAAVRMGKPLAPSILETSNTPANYSILGPSDNVHVLVEGSFPASSKAGANVGGLRFFKGCLKQYVYIKSEPSGANAEALMDFFKGSCEIDGGVLRFTCLKLDGVFINRRRKRYQTGTNKLAPGDPDYDEDKDGGAGWHITGDREEEDPEPETGLTKTDYIEAAKALLAAYGNAGTAGRTEEITARVLGGDFDPGMSVDDVFAALGMAYAASGGYSYNAGTHEVTVRGSAGQAANLELDDFLTRRRAVKEAAWLDWRERNRNVEESEPRRREEGEEEYPLTPQEVQQEKEKESFPMVQPSLHPDSGVACEDMPLNPFQIFAKGGQWYINEGEIASARTGVLKFPTTQIPAGLWRANRSFYVKPVPESGGGWKLVVKYHDNE